MALIVLVFAFASLAGATVAHAHRYVSTPIVVLNMVDEDNRSIPVVVQIQRGQIDLGAGLVMPCGQHHGIGVNAPLIPGAPEPERPEPGACLLLATMPGSQLLRPPISA
ncbi:hypothetical protein [Devosia sp. CAU 1758]